MQPDVSPRELRTQELYLRMAAARSEATRDRLFDELVTTNLGLCDALARRYAGRSVERDDLVQVARVGLVAAARRYRPELGHSFTAFAIPTITGEIKRHFRDFGWVIRPPRHLQELRAKSVARRGEAEQRLQRSVTAEDLSDDLGVPRSEIEECAMVWQGFRPLSLDYDLYPDSGPLTSQLAQDDLALERVADVVSLRESVAKLSRRDQAILRWRFEEGCTQREIGMRLGVSQMQVSRILTRILQQARELLDPTWETAAS